MYQLLIIILFIRGSTSLLGYDCAGPNLNITTISLNNVGECNAPLDVPTSRETYIQLLQLSDFSHSEVVQCRIEIDRTIYYCGMSSHISIVHNGRQNYLHELDEQGCRKLQETGILQLSPSSVLIGIRKNSTTSRAITLGGTLTNNGECRGTQYSDAFGSWDGVVIQATVKIVITNYRADVNLINNKILLQSGTQCALSDGTCMDVEGNSAFWTTEPTDSCQFNRYDVLFEGIATKYQNPDSADNNPDVFSLTTHETTFALAAKSEKHLCGYTLIRTEHPKLFILETQKGKTFAAKKQISVNNLDIFSYMNSKFIYVEKHIRTQLQNLYRDVVIQRCNLERQVIQNALNTASMFPEKFAKTIMKNHGYMAVVLGEVAHIIKCTPVDCSVRRTTECYNELPVTHQNKSLFLSPTSKILLKTGTQIECDPLLPALYYIDNQWYRFSPQGIPVPAPQELYATSQPTWKYNPVGDLAASGIYTIEEINQLRDRIMFPAERSALLNTIARGSAGYSIASGSIALHNLLNPETIEQITESTLNKMWHGLEKFGIVSAGFFAIAFIFTVIKAIVDIIIQGYTLHSLYGWSVMLIGAIWNSITHLLITRHYTRNNRQENIYEETHGQELTEIITQQPKPTPSKRRLSGVDPVLLERLTSGSQLVKP